MSRIRVAAVAVGLPLALGAVVLLAGTDGQGAAGPSAGSSVRPSAGPSAGSASGSGTAVVLREPTGAELDVLHAARELLLADCMRVRGFVYRPVPRQSVPEARDISLVVADTGWARRHGYGSDLKRAGEKAQREDPNQRYFARLSTGRRAAALAAANGARPTGLTARTPDGMTMNRNPDGCQSQADQALYGDLPAWFQASTTVVWLRSVAGERVGADPAFARAVRPWSACMRAAGHAFAGPAAIRAALPVPRAEEIRLAVAEATCAQSSGLAGTVSRLTRTHEGRLRERNRAAVDTASRLQFAALPRARSLTATRQR